MVPSVVRNLQKEQFRDLFPDSSFSFASKSRSLSDCIYSSSVIAASSHLSESGGIWAQTAFLHLIWIQSRYAETRNASFLLLIRILGPCKDCCHTFTCYSKWFLAVRFGVLPSTVCVSLFFHMLSTTNIWAWQTLPGGSWAINYFSQPLG